MEDPKNKSSFFDLKLRISPSLKEFKERIGPEAFGVLKNEVFQKNGFICQGGCNYDGNHNHSTIYIHLIEVHEDEPLKSTFTTLCKACLLTQHIDVAVEKEMVNIVNSSYSQARIIEVTRTRGSGLNQTNTRTLKTPASEIVEKIKNGTMSKQTKIKVVFTENFKFEN